MVGGSAVVGQAVVVDVESFEVGEGLDSCRPALGQEAKVWAVGGELVGAPHLQHIVAGQVFPEIAVLIGGVIGGLKRPLVGGTQIVGGGTGQFAGGLHPALALGEIPADRPQGGVGSGDGAGETAQHGLVELGPELQQGKGAVKPHVQAFVPGVVEALEHAKLTHRIACSSGGPEAAATG